MDGRGRWIDNVFIERLWRSLKYECVYLHAFETGSELRINTALRIPRTADVKVPLSPVRPLGGGSCFSVAARVGVEAALVGAQR